MKISKRKDRNLWYASVKKPGGGYTRVYGKTKREVREKYDELTKDMISGNYVEKSTLTVEEWSRRWRANYFVNLKPRTIENYTSVLKHTILPYFGHRRLQSIKHEDCQAFIVYLQDKKNYKPKTISGIHLVLHRMLRDAVTEGYLVSNPSDNILLPKIVKQEMMILQEDEIVLFLETVERLCPDFYDHFSFLLKTGLRVSEFLGLTVEQYNEKDKTLLINKQVNPRDNYSFTTPKHDVIRTLTLSDDLCEILERQIKKGKDRREFFKSTEIEFIFTNYDGNYIPYPTLWRRFKKVAREIKKPDLRIHDLRHTFATISLGSGVDLKTLQEILGHSDASFTLNRYGHSTNSMKRKASEKISEFFNNL